MGHPCYSFHIFPSIFGSVAISNHHLGNEDGFSCGDYVGGSKEVFTTDVVVEDCDCEQEIFTVDMVLKR